MAHLWGKNLLRVKFFQQNKVRAPKIDETTLSKKDNMFAILHGETINLGLDVDAFLRVRLQPGNVDLNIEMANAFYAVSFLAT